MKAISLLGALLLCLAPRCGDASQDAPRIAVIIDDFGLNYRHTPPDEDWCALPFRLTFADMPRSPRTKKAADLIRACGKELIVHFPFDPFLKLELPRGGEPSARDTRLVADLLDECFRTIPGAKGLNTHRSLKATQNPALMRWFLVEYKKRGLYFVDSAVTPKTVAYKEALAVGVPAVKNDLFLEGPHPSREECAKVMRMAAKLARSRGEAVVIGHHYHRSTYACLKEEIPKLEKEGFEFVYASRLARRR